MVKVLRKGYTTEFKGAYGWPRMVWEIKDRSIPAGKERIRLEQNFATQRGDQVWTAGIDESPGKLLG
jgi:hypothetical protein